MMKTRFVFVCGLAAWICHAAVALAQPATQAAQSADLAGQKADARFKMAAQLQPELARQVEALVGRLSDRNIAKRQAAFEQLSAGMTEYYESLVAFCDDSEIEVGKRARETLRQSLSQARMAKALWTLSKPQQDLLLELWTSDERAFDSVFTPGGASILRTRFYELPPLLEPLVIVSLRLGSEQSARAAAALAAVSEFKSDELVDAMADSLAKAAVMGESQAVDYRGIYDSGQAVTASAISTLGRLKNPRALPVLLAALLHKKPLTADAAATDLAIADLIGAHNDPSVIPPIIERLSRIDAAQEQVLTVKEMNIASQDPLLALLIKFAGISADDAKLVTLRQPAGVVMRQSGQSLAGFASKDDRTAATAKVMQWWAANKSSDTYAKLPKLTLPELAKTVDRAPDKTPATKAVGPAGAAWSGAVVKRLGDDLRQDRPTRRQAAQDSLLAVQQVYLSSLLASRDGADQASREAAAHLVEMAATDANYYSVMAGMDAAMRKKLAAARVSFSRTVEQMFGPDRTVALAATRSIPTLHDPDAMLEPLIIYNLTQDEGSVIGAAAAAATSGKYKSDALVDALHQVFVGSSSMYFNWYMALMQPTANSHPQPLALEALAKIGTPRAIAAIAHQFEASHRDMYRSIAIARALETGADKRAIPLLLAGLDGQATSILQTQAADGKRIGWCGKDSTLSVLLKLTGQTPDAYSMIKMERALGGVDAVVLYGFESEALRNESIKKFKDWWEKSKDQKPYKGLEFLEPYKPPTAKTVPAASEDVLFRR